MFTAEMKSLLALKSKQAKLFQLLTQLKLTQILQYEPDIVPPTHMPGKS